MVKSWAMIALSTSALFSTARAACADIDQYLSIPSPMTGDLEINLDAVDTIECEEIGGNAEVNADGLETVIVSGGTLTLKSSSNVRFVNMAFTVMPGANLVFDMPKTNFGPNTEGQHRTPYIGITVRVEEGASATFLGQVVAKEVTNAASLFRNAGTMEFKKRVVFQDGGNVFHTNTGVVNFGGDATFKDNRYLALSNQDSAYVSFAKKATFDNNAFNFDGANGCSVENFDTSTTIFGGRATFRNNDCREGAAVLNEGDITFNGKAYFNDNENDSEGGGVANRGGTMAFKAAAQFNNNITGYTGGGIYVNGGEVVFSRAVTFDGNTAESGSAFSVKDGTLIFEKPNKVRSRNAILSDPSDELSCTFGDVSDGATLIGFTGDDVCIPASAA